MNGPRLSEMVPVGLLVLLAFAVVLAVVGARTQETQGSGRATGLAPEAVSAATGSHSPVVPARPDHTTGIRSNLELTVPLVGIALILFIAWAWVPRMLRQEMRR